EGPAGSESEPEPKPDLTEVAKDVVTQWAALLDSGDCSAAAELATANYVAECQRLVAIWTESYVIDAWWDPKVRVVSDGMVEVGVYSSGKPGSDGSAIEKF